MAAPADAQKPASRALAVIEGGRPSEPRTAASFRDGRAEAGFLTQLIVGNDPSLRTSRPIRARQAAERYAEMARLIG
ncbi:hypothetical protein [Methylobacterium persicinum]|uniref:Uncharacterized protein n=1 Tax=Methylobacterium persicinum TaxID=374426 RepID=A0ABU0HET9_9HYPH|nr:hypothetical protein [Methylobacterium persicinum]MDQ0440843.1 hypothetical protein [Methylobacterium persicinum]